MYYISIERNDVRYYLKDLVSLSHKPSEGSDYSDGMFYSEWTPMFWDRNVFQLKTDAEEITNNYTKKGDICVHNPTSKHTETWTGTMKWTVSS